MSARRQGEPRGVKGIERAAAPRTAIPIIFASALLTVVAGAPRLVPTQGRGEERVSGDSRPAVISQLSNSLLARVQFSAAGAPVAIARHRFFAIPDVTPGRVVLRVRLAELPADRRTPERYRCFFAAGGWEFRPDGFAWLVFDGDWLVSQPFDPAPEARAPYELRLRFDFMERAAMIDLAEVELLLHRASTAFLSPKAEVREALQTSLGEPLVLEVEPWGGGTFASAVGFRVRSPVSAAIPVQVEVIADGGEGKAARTFALTVADISRRRAWSPEWLPITMDLRSLFGRRVRITLNALPVDAGSAPALVDVYWQVGRTY